MMDDIIWLWSNKVNAAGYFEPGRVRVAENQPKPRQQPDGTWDCEVVFEVLPEDAKPQPPAHSR